MHYYAIFLADSTECKSRLLSMTNMWNRIVFLLHVFCVINSSHSFNQNYLQLYNIFVQRMHV